MNIKHLSRVEIKDADRGEVVAVFSTLNVKDADGDVTRPGAFADGAPVRISAYGHASWAGALPVGKGAIRETATEALLEGRFFVDTQAGSDTFVVVKEMGDLQEWSYGYDVLAKSFGDHEGERVRFLEALDVHEVSPVLKGAGVGTRTLEAKARKQLNSELHAALRNAGRERWADDDTYVWVEDYDPDESYVIYEVCPDDGAPQLLQVVYTRGSDGAVALDDAATEVQIVRNYAPKSARFASHATSVLADVAGLITRASEIQALRAAKGKTLSSTVTDLLGSIATELKRLDELLGASPHATPDLRDALAREAARFVAITQGVA